MSERLAVAVIGAGVIGRTHIETLARMDGMALSALVEPSEDGRALADQLGVPCLPDVAALIDLGSGAGRHRRHAERNPSAGQPGAA